MPLPVACLTVIEPDHGCPAVPRVRIRDGFAVLGPDCIASGIDGIADYAQSAGHGHRAAFADLSKKETAAWRRASSSLPRIRPPSIRFVDQRPRSASTL